MGDGGGGCVADVMVGHYAFLWGTNIMDISGKGEVIHTLQDVPAQTPGCLAPLSVHLTSKNLFSWEGWDWWVRLSSLWQKTQVTETERKKN